jgi:predicted GNAT family acetyltransferase
MRSRNAISILAAALLVIGSVTLLPADQKSTDACSLLTQDQVSAALGVSVTAGAHPVESMRYECDWSEPGKAIQGKHVMLNIMGQMGSLTPAQRFENAKAPVRGITKTPLTGVGDDAYYIVAGTRVTLNVKRGSSVIQIIVTGVPAEQGQAIAKTLAQNAVTKL